MNVKRMNKWKSCLLFCSFRIRLRLIQQIFLGKTGAGSAAASAWTTLNTHPNRNIQCKFFQVIYNLSHSFGNAILAVKWVKIFNFLKTNRRVIFFENGIEENSIFEAWYRLFRWWWYVCGKWWCQINIKQDKQDQKDL